ncbi:retinol dehydrogenase 14-like [Brevipalpus obovatus]|uniref:retinol dehydrogenase 14-like n=1 Tax=Brevipalpus obovatus TaxID=246614 RepID=UPI003D9EE56F
MKILSLGKVALEVFSGLFFARFLLLKSWRKFREPQQVLGKTFLITGANSGIGKALTENLYNMGANVIMVCRNSKSGQEVADQIREGSSSGPGSITLKTMDLSSLRSVRKSAEDILQCSPKINVIINNAAVMQAPFKMTEDGFENHIAVNHLSHALLTNLMLPKLAQSCTQEDPGRIVFVTSSLYKKGTVLEEDFKPNAKDEKAFVRNRAYSNSKLANLLYAKELAVRIQREGLPITVNLASPGMCYTNLGRHFEMSLLKKLLFLPFALLFFKTPAQGAQTILHAAASSKTVGLNGAYFGDMVEQKIVDVKSELTAKRIFDLTTHAIRDV